MVEQFSTGVVYHGTQNPDQSNSKRYFSSVFSSFGAKKDKKKNDFAAPIRFLVATKFAVLLSPGQLTRVGYFTFNRLLR